MSTHATTELRRAAHVFVFGLGGRTGTTALQNILTATGQIHCWGEYPRFAFSDWVAWCHSLVAGRVSAEPSGPAVHPRGIVHAALSAVGPHPDTGRGGSKQLTVRGVDTLHQLRAVFPRALYVFAYRDPVKQWRSLRRFARHHVGTDTAENFAREYVRLAAIYGQVDGYWVRQDRVSESTSELCSWLGLPTPAAEATARRYFPTPDRPPVSVDDRKTLERLGAAECFERLKRHGVHGGH